MKKELTREEIEKIKSDVCDTRCRWLADANKTVFHNVHEIDQVKKVLQMCCESCPLNRL